MTLATVLQESETARESWRYTSLRALKDIAFSPADDIAVAADALPAPLAAENQRLVFINGVISPALSTTAQLPSGLLHAQANHLTLTLAAETCLAPQPLELLFIWTKAEAAQQSATQLTLQLGSHARLTLLERHVSFGTGAAHAALVKFDITLAEQAKLLHSRFQTCAPTDYHLATTNATLGKGAYYDQFCLSTGAALSRHSINVTLAAPEAQTRLLSAYLLHGAQHGDTTSTIRHNAPQTTSQEHYRGVLSGKARGVFQGKIIVAAGAQKSDGQQMSRALLLSPQAEANSKPELEIYADDVKCSHGATIGQLDDAALFYLQSRGIAKADARALLTAAFLTELLEAMGDNGGRTAAQKLVDSWLNTAEAA